MKDDGRVFAPSGGHERRAIVPATWRLARGDDARRRDLRPIEAFSLRRTIRSNFATPSCRRVCAVEHRWRRSTQETQTPSPSPWHRIGVTRRNRSTTRNRFSAWILHTRGICTNSTSGVTCGEDVERLDCVSSSRERWTRDL